MKFSTYFLKACILICFATCFNEAIAQWRNIASEASYRIKEIDFPTKDIAYCYMDKNGSGKETFFKSTDAGLNWVNIPLDPVLFNNANLLSISFPSEKIGYIVFAKNAPRLTTFLCKTIDGGISWDTIMPPNSNRTTMAAMVDFPTEQVGYYSVGNTIYSTKNGGQSWTSKWFSNLNFGDIKDLDFYDGNHGILGAWDGSFIYKGAIYSTSDGGASWDSLVFDSANTSIGIVQQVHKSFSIAMDENGWPNGQRIYKSFNNGKSWDTLSISFLKDSADNAVDVHFRDAKIGYLATTKGYIYMTVDGGKSWVISHKEKFGLTFLASNGATMYTSGTVNLFLVEDLNLGTPYVEVAGRIGVYPNPVSKND